MLLQNSFYTENVAPPNVYSENVAPTTFQWRKCSPNKISVEKMSQQMLYRRKFGIRNITIENILPQQRKNLAPINCQYIKYWVKLISIKKILPNKITMKIMLT